VLNPLFPPSVHCSYLQFLTCCRPQHTVHPTDLKPLHLGQQLKLKSPSNNEGLLAFTEPPRFLFKLLHFYDHICWNLKPRISEFSSFKCKAFGTKNNTLLKNMYSSEKHNKIIKKILHMLLTRFYMKGETQECTLNRKEK